jgi:energy-converting hydrogenase Eha subunit A
MGSPDLSVWILVLLVQTVPYLAAIIMSLVSALPLPARLIGTPKPTRHQASVAGDDYDGAASRPGNS